MHPAGFWPIISAEERAQTYALDREATGIGDLVHHMTNIQGRVRTFISDCCIVAHVPCCVLRVRKVIFVIYVSRKYFSGGQGKHEMIVARGTYVGKEKCIRDFVWQSLWTKNAWNT